MLITGPKSDLTKILEAQDRAAYLPLPPSVYRHGQRINVCPECMTEIALHKFEEAGSLAPWQCSECGWEPGLAARTTCVESLCAAVLIEGEFVAQVAWQGGGAGKEAGQAKGRTDLAEAGLPEASDLAEAGRTKAGGGSDPDLADLAEAFSRVLAWSPAKPVEAGDSEPARLDPSSRPDPA